MIDNALYNIYHQKTEEVMLPKSFLKRHLNKSNFHLPSFSTFMFIKSRLMKNIIIFHLCYDFLSFSSTRLPLPDVTHQTSFLHVKRCKVHISYHYNHFLGIFIPWNAFWILSYITCHHKELEINIQNILSLMSTWLIDLFRW